MSKKTLTISLDSLLRTGNFGELRSGMSKEEVTALLGSPDRAGVTLRKSKTPRIFVYGPIELWFEATAPHGLTSLWWEADERGSLSVPKPCQIQDWAFTPDWTQEQVELYLNEHGIAFTHHALPTALTLANGIMLTFDLAKQLTGLYMTLPHEQ